MTKQIKHHLKSSTIEQQNNSLKDLFKQHTDQTGLHKHKFYPITAYFMSAGLNLLHLSDMQLKQAGGALHHVKQVLFSKRAMASILKSVKQPTIPNPVISTNNKNNELHF